MKVIVAFHGQKAMGKTTAASIVATEHGARRISFAEPLYRMVSCSFDIPLSVLHDRATKEAVDPRYGVSPRRLLQRTGDGIRAAFGTDVFIRTLVDTVARSDWPFYVVDDCRYVAEVNALRRLEENHPMALYGYVIHLERTDAAGPVDDHRSETEAALADGVDGRIEWSAAKPLDSQVVAEIRRLCGRFMPVRRAMNLAAIRGGWTHGR